MNGAGVQQTLGGHDGKRYSDDGPAHFSAGKMLVESYTNDMGESDKPLYNPVSFYSYSLVRLLQLSI